MKVSAYLVAPALALSGLALAAAPASAHTMSTSAHTCSGTGSAPGVLAGTYWGDVVIKGFCQVNGGAAVVNGNLTLAPNSALNATFALNDVAHSGTSSLLVRGNLRVQKGAVLAMGCLPVHSPCSDDPKAATGGTLTGVNEVDGSLAGSDALAVIVHASKIYGSVDQNGGGGGPATMTCKVPTSGVFAALQSPVFSDYEDNAIAGKLTVTGLRTCWFGALRDNVGGSVRVEGDKFGDPDADEVDSNVISGSMSCFGNTPAVQFGDAVGGTPNKVQGNASGQCAFTVRLHNPVPSGPLTPISVRG
ncbi:hypothetical protein [Actinospica sp.]|uniref:hypothetical protein n=1 Tax=Actinospica sp. TaxID=1872142 RepID=UPI002B5E337C|nr:hypothetical protein [Actinospica sp.]HWG28322.1 hypothetical protein [Actinospica sp.]